MGRNGKVCECGANGGVVEASDGAEAAVTAGTNGWDKNRWEVAFRGIHRDRQADLIQDRHEFLSLVACSAEPDGCGCT